MLASPTALLGLSGGGGVGGGWVVVGGKGGREGDDREVREVCE